MGLWRDTGLSIPFASGAAIYGIEFNSKIYVGTQAGYLYESTALGAFVKVADPIIVSPFVVGCPIQFMFSLGGSLYAWSGSTTCLLRWSGTAWTFLSKGDNNGFIAQAAVKAGTIYAVAGARFYSWDGVSATMTTITDTGITQQAPLVLASDGYMYGSASGRLFRSNGGAYTQVAPAATTVDSIVEFNGLIYGIGAGVKLLQWNGTAWVTILNNLDAVARLYGSLVYNGRIYTALKNSNLSGNLYSWKSGAAWTVEAPVFTGWREVQSIFLYQGARIMGVAAPTSGSVASKLLQYYPNGDGIMPMGGF